ncbi:MAG: hypothetical protein QME96_17065, partial [Myxococcota bacterium]|nr:hypothetical protein [Myxococcota bacterium]
RLWDARGIADPASLGFFLGGDPVGGRNDCDEDDDDLGDDLQCPENDYTCEHQRCAVRANWCDGVPGDECPGRGCEGLANVRCMGSDAYILTDVHNHGHWLPAFFARYSALAGRYAAIDLLGCLLTDPIYTDTPIFDTSCSIFSRLARPGGSCPRAAVLPAFAYEACRAAREGATGDYAEFLDDVCQFDISSILDRATSTAWHGEIAEPGPTPWDIGLQTASNYLAGGIIDPFDEHVFYLLGGRDYEVRLSATTMPDVPLEVWTLPIPPTPSVPPVVPIPIGLSTIGTDAVSFRVDSTGFYHFGVHPVVPWGEELLYGAMYELTVTLTGDDHPDQVSESVILPARMDDMTVAGRLGRTDWDYFRVYVPRVMPTPMPIRVQARSTGGIRWVGSRGVQLLVRGPTGTHVGSCVFGTRTAGSCSVAISSTSGGIYTVILGALDPSSTGTYVLDTAPVTAGDEPRLGCTASSLTPGVPPSPQCDLGTNPFVSGVLYDGGQREHLWFHAHEGQVYSLRFWSQNGVRASVHHPSSDRSGTSPTGEPLFRLRGEP